MSSNAEDLAQLIARRQELDEKIRRLEADTVGVETSGKRNVTIHGSAEGTIIVTGDGARIPARDAEPELLWRAYLASLADDCSKLPLGVIDTKFVRGGGQRRVRLGEVYVELDVTRPGRPEEEDDDERGWSWRLVRGEAQGRIAARDVLAGDGRRWVLLGDPGSGKTTFAHHLCRALALGEGLSPGGDQGGDPLPEGLTGLLPIRFVLRDVAARQLGKVTEGSAGLLWNALRDELAATVGDDAAPRLLTWVQERLMKDGGLVVFDGLDEVPSAHRHRRILLDSVEDLAAALGEPSRVLVTARPYAYADPKWHLEGFELLALAPFNAEQVERFVDGWYLTAARQAFSWSEETAAAKARQLRRALANRPYLGDLASRPLLLTLMATLHSSWGQLPEGRADLYEETVKLLLGRWQRARETAASGEEAEESLSQLLQVEESRVREALEALAYKVHERQGGEDEERDTRPADISEGELLVAFKPLLRGEVTPDRLLAYLEERAGLLVHRREGVYAFPHRSFQEYLAACHVGGQPEPSERFRELAFLDPAWWREVVLLGIGRARRSGLGNAVDHVTKLQLEESGAPEEQDHVSVLCGQALRELRLQQRVGERSHYQGVLDEARQRLVTIVDGGRMSPKERLEAGDVLGYLGDPRTGVGVVRVGEEEVPSIDWVEVPDGIFTMGSAKEDRDALSWERPQHEVSLDRFWIGRYPVTNAQYRLFCEGEGYDNRAYWTDAGWEWLQGAEIDVSGYPEEWRERFREWFAGRPQEKRRQPFFWDDEKLAAPSRPVVGVTWFEAVAFCRWLTARLRAQDGPVLPGIGGVVNVTLPSEAQWEKAARGESKRIWPWGDEFSPGDCNSEEVELGQPSPVGMFPKNRSSVGVEDMAGSVWEWNSTVWGRSWDKPEFSYPYVADDGREGESSPALRVVRGGSCYNGKPHVRCASRFRDGPESFNDFIGFRVVLSLANPEF